MAYILAMRIVYATRVFANIGVRYIVDRQTQQAIWLSLNNSSVVWIDAICVQEPFNVWLGPSRCTGRKTGLHSLVHLDVADLFQECWWLSFWSFVTAEMQ